MSGFTFEPVSNLWPVIVLIFGAYALLQAFGAARDNERNVAIGLMIISLLLIGLAFHIDQGDRSIHQIFGESFVTFL